MEADGELASGKFGRIAHETELDAIAPDRAPRRHRHARFAAEGDRLIGPLDQRWSAHLQAHEHVVEGDGLRAEYVAQPQARLPPPNVGPHDQAKRLVVRPGLRGGKGEPLIRLRRWVPDGVGPMRGGDPAHDPCRALLRRERVRKKKDDARYNQKHEPPHGLSSRLSQPASNCRGWLQILFTG